jgi:hypothetical protein
MLPPRCCYAIVKDVCHRHAVFTPEINDARRYYVLCRQLIYFHFAIFTAEPFHAIAAADISPPIRGQPMPFRQRPLRFSYLLLILMIAAIAAAEPLHAFAASFSFSLRYADYFTPRRFHAASRYLAEADSSHSYAADSQADTPKQIAIALIRRHTPYFSLRQLQPRQPPASYAMR